MAPDTVVSTSYGPGLWGLDAALGAGRRLGLGPSLTAEALLDGARRQTDLDDWGGEEFRPLLERLLAVLYPLPLTSLARVLVHQTLSAALATRLRFEQLYREHPELAATPIERPLFIVGLPRTGTTALHHLLSLDPGVYAPQLWELQTPLPVCADRAADRRRRELTAALLLRVALQLTPERRAMHRFGPNAPEECWMLMAPSLAVLNFDLQTGASAWGDHLFTQDLAWAYREYRRYMQLIADRHQTSRLVLKCPEHTWFLEALLAVFPDAGIVWAHRDPGQALASYASMMAVHRRLFFGRVDHRELGSHLTDRFVIGLRRATEARERAGEARFCDTSPS